VSASIAEKAAILAVAVAMMLKTKEVNEYVHAAETYYDVVAGISDFVFHEEMPPNKTETLKLAADYTYDVIDDRSFNDPPNASMILRKAEEVKKVATDHLKKMFALFSSKYSGSVKEAKVLFYMQTENHEYGDCWKFQFSDHGIAFHFPGLVTTRPELEHYLDHRCSMSLANYVRRTVPF